MARDKSNLILAVAGSGKTRQIVNECCTAALDQRILIITYTKNNQDELRTRLAAAAGKHALIEVQGWFSFLLSHFVRPFLPFVYPDKRLHGFDFQSPPQKGSNNESYYRYFNRSGHARKVHLPQLATRINSASDGVALRTLARRYDRIYIDEVQDLCGYDLEVLKLLMGLQLPLQMVGDVRQAVIATNDREPKNKQYMFMGIWRWFQEQEKAGRLRISQMAETWRCRPEIATFADSLFGESWGFTPTTSRNLRTTDHDGIFLVRSSDVHLYLKRFSPQCLIYSAASAKKVPGEAMNYNVSKGLTRERVLVWPTQPIEKFLRTREPLKDKSAAALYVAVTRAQQSAAFVIDKSGNSELPKWDPTD